MTLQIGKPASPANLVDREEEVNSIVSKMKSKINYNIAVIGYRRIGKSSILKKAADILSKDAKTVVVYFDVQKHLGDPKTFLTNLENTIFDAYIKKISSTRKLQAKAAKIDIVGKISEALTSKKISGISMEISPGSAGQDPSVIPKLEFKDKFPDYMSMFLSVFKTANALAARDNLKFIIILDEFQDIIKLHKYKGLRNILDLFRSVIQERGDNVSYVVCGSQVHLVRSILAHAGSSLFQHFVEICVGEMTKKNAILLFNEYLKVRGFEPDDKIASRAYSLVGGQPYYLMALAEGWRSEKQMSEVFENLLTSSIGSLRLYAEYVLAEDIAKAQGGPMLRSILVKLAESESGLSVSEISKAVSSPMTAIVPYINELIKNDLVLKEGKSYRIRDAVVKEYLRLNS